MLFYCVFADEPGFLIDVSDEKAARAAAREDVGEEPTHVREIPVGVFGARVSFDDDPDDPDGEIVDCELVPHVMDILAAIEDECAELGEITCMSEAEDDAHNVVRCELVAGHPDTVKHRAGALEWSSP